MEKPMDWLDWSTLCSTLDAIRSSALEESSTSVNLQPIVRHSGACEHVGSNQAFPARSQSDPLRRGG